MMQHHGKNSIRWALYLFVGLLSATAWGCASDSHTEDLTFQQDRTRQDLTALKAEIATMQRDIQTMQRDLQTRIADLEQQTRRVQEETTIERQKAPSARRLQTETQELRRQIDQYADKTKHMLSALIQAFVDVANEIQEDSPSKETDEPPLPEERAPEPREPRH